MIKKLYRSGYSDAALEHWYKRINIWSQGKQPDDAKLITSHEDTSHKARDVYCYFDNTDKLWAPFDAREILEKFDLAKDLEEEPGKLSAPKK